MKYLFDEEMTSAVQTTLQEYVLDCFQPAHERFQAREVYLDGTIKSGQAPKEPHPSKIYQTIKVPDLPAPPGSKLGV